MSSLEVRIPDMGTDEPAEVVEILVASGEEITVEQSLVTLETDKASMDVPSTAAGVLEKVTVKVGDKVKPGDLIATITAESSGGTDAVETEESEASSEPEPEGNQSGAEKKPPAESRSESKASDESPAADQEEAESPETDKNQDDGSADSVPESQAAPKAATPATASDAEVQAEVVVIGSGPGGYTAAFRAADLGKKVVLVERYSTLGGVCLNVGCIPSKAYLHVARVIEEAKDLGDHGVSFGEPELDLEKLRAFKGDVVGRLTSGLASMAKQRGIEVVTGTALFTGPNSIDVESAEGKRSVSFQNAVIAAGSRVVEIPGIPYDDPRIMDSTSALTLPEVPKRLLIVGGGIIGLEMATVYGALGSEITVVELLDALIPGCDRDLVKPFERRLKKRYKAKIHTSTKVLGIAAEESGLVASLEGKRAPETAEFDLALISVGRRPNSDRLNLEATGIQVGDRGLIEVDNQMRTHVPHIFAIGDIVPGPALAHKATHEGKVAAEVIAGEASHFDARVIPSVAYTDPEIAWVGLTETAAKADGTAYEIGAFPWTASGRAIGMGRTEGLTKLLFDPQTKKLLGAGVVGPGAGDLISELALAIEMDCEAADIGLTIHPHPTLSETIAMASEVFEGTVTDLYLKKKR